jgi:HSP20 family protein
LIDIFMKGVISMNGSMNPYGDLFAELNRLQRSFDQVFRPAGAANVRALPRHTFPLINVASTPEAIEVLALAPGIDPGTLQVTFDKGLLVMAGERKDDMPQEDDLAMYTQERFNGTFRRVISLPEDVDPNKINATYRDGLLRIAVSRQESSKPRRIEVM